MAEDKKLVDVNRTVPFFGRIELRQAPVEEVETRILEACKEKAKNAVLLMARHAGIREQNRRNIATLNAENARKALLAQAIPRKTP